MYIILICLLLSQSTLFPLANNNPFSDIEVYGIYIKEFKERP